MCGRFSVGVVSDKELFRFLLGIYRPRKGVTEGNALTRHLVSEINISENASFASLVANAAGNSLACFQVLEQRYDRANRRIVASMLRGSQQPEAIIGKYGCPPRRKIPEVEGIRQNNGRTGIFDQWRSLSRRSSVIGERLVAFAAVL